MEFEKSMTMTVLRAHVTHGTSGRKIEMMLAWRKAFHRKSSAYTIAGCGFPPAMVEVTSDHNRTKLKAQVPNEQQQRDAHRTSIRASVVDVDVRDCCKVGA